MITHIVYVTPAGAICTCGATYPTISGGAASRLAYTHLAKHKEAADVNRVIDLRSPMTTDLFDEYIRIRKVEPKNTGANHAIDNRPF